jgi:hypothetical protein
MDPLELGSLLRQAASSGCEDGIKRASKYMVANCGQDDKAIDACLTVWQDEVRSNIYPCSFVWGTIFLNVLHEEAKKNTKYSGRILCLFPWYAVSYVSLVMRCSSASI